MVKMGVIGAGYLGQWHIKNLQSLTNTELIGFFDADSERRTQIAQEFQVPICYSLADLLEKCDAVSIVVPTIAHYQVAKSALLKNKHVFCENPLCKQSPKPTKSSPSRSKKNGYYKWGILNALIRPWQV